jgi:hypothetical protein
MKHRSTMCTIALLTLITVIPAFANTIGTVTATDSCSGFAITVSGTGLGPKTITTDFTITLTPTSGPPITVSGSFVVTKIPKSGGSYNTTYSSTWAAYGVTLASSYTLTGKASFVPTRKGSYKSITFTPPTLDCVVVTGSCQPSSSLGVLASGKNVTAYVPNGSWGNTSSTGVEALPIEGVGSPAAISTPNAVNSCASNSTTGETVCTSDFNDVYLISGSTLNSTVSSGGDTYAGFSGGTCITCGVAMNASANKAVVTIGLSSAPSGSGLQILDLASSTFGTPIPFNNEVSEDVLWDQGRNLILSPQEGGNYDLFNTSTSTEYANFVGFGYLDSAAEECTTGIALSTDEGTTSLFIADLTQATFGAGTWSDTGEQFQNFPEFGNFAAGTSGIAIAQGTHLGIVTGEFGGNWMGVIQLPSTSGSGVPAVQDYAAAQLPNTPDGATFVQGADPHTVTAYVSPNSGDAVGLMSNGYFVAPTWMAVIDLTKLLAAPRTGGTHYVDPTFDLITGGVVTYIPIP